MSLRLEKENHRADHTNRPSRRITDRTGHLPRSTGALFRDLPARRYADAGIPDTFVQDNYSQSMKGALRGLHYQEPHAQGKTRDGD